VGGRITILTSGNLDSNGVAGAEATFIDGATDLNYYNGNLHVIAGILFPESYQQWFTTFWYSR